MINNNIKDEQYQTLLLKAKQLPLYKVLDLDIDLAIRFFIVLHPTLIGKKWSRLIECDFAERVLPKFENRHPGDVSLRRALETSRQYACNSATAEELQEARREAVFAHRDSEPVFSTTVLCVIQAADKYEDRSYITAFDAACVADNYSKEREWQIKHVRKMLKKIEEGKHDEGRSTRACRNTTNT